MLKRIVLGGLLAAVAVGVVPSASAAPQSETRCAEGFEVVCFVLCYSPHPKLDRCA